MKRLVTFLVIIAVLAMSMFLVACSDDTAGGKGGQTETSADTGAEEVKSDGKITVKTEDGKEFSVPINIVKAPETYYISAPEELKAVADDFSANIEKKIGLKISIVKNAPDSIPQIALSVSDETLGADDYTINSNGDKITIEAGSKAALEKATDVYLQYFVYAKKNTILLPVGNGYECIKKFYANSITIDGIDISQFEICVDPEDYSVNADSIKSKTLANELAGKFENVLLGTRLPVAAIMEEGKNYIMLSAHSTNLTDYSVKIENGNVYLTGSYLSIDYAVNDFISEIIGYKENAESYGNTVEIKAENSKEGTVTLEIPYTKEELHELLIKAYDDPNMLISGSHTFSGDMGQGRCMQATVDRSIEKTGECVSIIELDVGAWGPYHVDHKGEDTFSAYDLSRIASECLLHVSNGGIVMLCQHLTNPLMNAPDKVWYRGIIGNDDSFKQLYTEGTDLNEGYLKSIDGTLRLIKTLDDNGIPLMYRPFHEMQGDWFWWCIQQGNIAKLQSDTWTGLWKYTYKHVTETLGLDNMLWVYSSTGKEINYCYPGDEYVDITGIDWYTSGKQEVNNNGAYSDLMKLGKPVALTEFGPGGSLERKDVEGNTYYTYDNKDFWRDITWMQDNGLKMSFFCTWTWGMSVIDMEYPEAVMGNEIVYNRGDLLEYWKNN